MDVRQKSVGSSAECGLGMALAVIRGKWKPTIIWEVHERPLRFRELVRRIHGISEKVLFEQLRELEADGVIHRQVFDELPARVEYSLTKAGAALNEAVHSLAKWGTDYGAVRRCSPLPV